MFYVDDRTEQIFPDLLCHFYCVVRAALSPDNFGLLSLAACVSVTAAVPTPALPNFDNALRRARAAVLAAELEATFGVRATTGVCGIALIGLAGTFLSRFTQVSFLVPPQPHPQP